MYEIVCHKGVEHFALTTCRMAPGTCREIGTTSWEDSSCVTKVTLATEDESS